MGWQAIHNPKIIEKKSHLLRNWAGRRVVVCKKSEHGWEVATIELFREKKRRKI